MKTSGNEDNLAKMLQNVVDSMRLTVHKGEVCQMKDLILVLNKEGVNTIGLMGRLKGSLQTQQICVSNMNSDLLCYMTFRCLL